MRNNASCAPATYYDSVMIWGNLSPWTKLGVRLKHQIRFDPSDVVRDGRGNILSMPVLEDKPCFGRPEAVFRHGQRSKKIKLSDGRIVDSTRHQCALCPAGVHEACVRTAYERVTSDPHISLAFRAWKQHCDTFFNGRFTCTGSASRLWGAFKLEIARRGPFVSSNDKAVTDLELQRRDALREKWKIKKREQRQLERQNARLARQPPSQQFVRNLEDERDRRFDALLAVLGQSGQPPSRIRVPADKWEATATITANAWAVRELLQASGRNAGPGSIARQMAQRNLNAGVAASTLKARMKNDLKRADECERDGLWKPFDPDADLDSYENEDDDAADELNDPVSEIDHVLSDLNLANLSLP